MARGTQHIKKRPKQASKRPVEHRQTERRQTNRSETQGMFFPMLRRQARWVFVLLALVFAGGFVLFGVGSGSSGLGDILNGWLNRGGGNGTSISKLERTARENPRSAQAFRELATAYEGDQRTSDAIRALQRYTTLRPKDGDALQELGGLYQRELSDVYTQAQTIQAASPVADASPFQPSSTTPLGRAYTTAGVLQDPLSQAVSSQVTEELTKLQTKLMTLQSKLLATEKRVVALDPTDPTAQFQLAQAADSVGDTATALTAYRKFLQLSPDDPLAAQVKQRVKQLTAPASAGGG